MILAFVDLKLVKFLARLQSFHRKQTNEVEKIDLKNKTYDRKCV